MTDRLPGFSTLAVHAGAQPDPTTGARVTPIYQTTSFVFNDADHAASLFGLQAFGNIYTRIGNPTNAVLEERVAALEGGTAALAVASGHAAQVVVLQQLLRPGDEFIAARKLYGGSINQFTHAFKSFGWNVVWADPDDIDSFERAVTPHTKAIFIESIANPAGSITDIEAIAAVARKAGVPLIVDNTLATPYLIRPIDHGADIVVHSLTKFLGGHGNSLGGIIVDAGTFDWSKDNKYPMLSEPRPEYHGIKIQETFGNFAFAIACRVLGLRDLGPALSPFNAFLILTGIETLPLRMQKHCDNAKAVAEFLSGHPAVASVNYSGLAGEQVQQPRAQICAEGRGRRVHLQPQGRLRRRRQAGVEPETVLASRQCRRHPLAGDPPGLDHAQPARRCRQDQVGRGPRRGAAVDRHRGQGRSDRRSGAGAERVRSRHSGRARKREPRNDAVGALAIFQNGRRRWLPRRAASDILPGYRNHRSEPPMLRFADRHCLPPSPHAEPPRAPTARWSIPARIAPRSACRRACRGRTTISEPRSPMPRRTRYRRPWPRLSVYEAPALLYAPVRLSSSRCWFAPVARSVRAAIGTACPTPAAFTATASAAVQVSRFG